ncbi:M61 family metallopeptidase [Leptospira wolffii]|uniref:M61 family metallopeptidase n=1 Tax=Leptospira wolffii TaxID=409998 RepID=UPI0002FE4FAB|nr:M61 family metallopeptidase [Leptospira wolffii]EPG66085.1 peptidase, M61 glycyl aminopeptidase family protein [Leptospira wolffii serovar Khorat str. Khorat-H2]
MTVRFVLDPYKPHQHYIRVEMEVRPTKQETLVCIPNWSPGSYKIRDYSKSIHQVSLIQPKPGWTLEQIDLDTWKVHSKGETFRISYLVFGFEHTVRTNYFTSEFILLHPPATFLYPKDQRMGEIEISWKNLGGFHYCHTGLEKKDSSKNTWKARNLDELFDSPILLTDEKALSFDTEGCKFDLVVLGEVGSSDKKKIATDLEKIVSTQIRTMGGTENAYYLFVLDMTENLYGGLEHSNSSINQFDPYGFTNPENYRTLMELLSHEYFHHWNVKRIRPIALGPFDYQKPNLTKELWIAEGITSFFDAYFLLICEVYSPQQYLNKIWKDILELEESEGESWMSLEDSSFTAWTKYYNRPQDPNFSNTGISYYTKGAILALSMDLFLLSESKGEKSLVDVMKALYKNFHLEKKRGFTKTEFFQAAKKATGFDLKLEFERYLSEPQRIPVEKYLHKIGVRRTNSSPKSDPGFRVKEEKGRLLVNKVLLNKNIRDSDINVGDEWISIDNRRVLPGNFKDLLNYYSVGGKAELLLARRGTIVKRKIKFDKTPSQNELWLDEKADKNEIFLREKFLFPNKEPKTEYKPAVKKKGKSKPQ